MKIEKNSCILEVIKGDITKQPDMDIIVNAANSELQPGGGVAGAIHRAAGKELQKACQSLAPIKPGEAVITEAFQLPNQYIIHCLGPVFGVDRPEAEFLEKCYLNALELAEEKHVNSIAFPSLSTGAFGYPIDDASEVAIRAVSKKMTKLEYIKHIRFVLFSDDDLKIYERTLKDICY